MSATAASGGESMDELRAGLAQRCTVGFQMGAKAPFFITLNLVIVSRKFPFDRTFPYEYLLRTTKTWRCLKVSEPLGVWGHEGVRRG